MEEKTFFTAKEAAEYLGKSKQTIYNYERAGKLPSQKVNDVTVFNKSDLDKIKLTKPREKTIISVNNLKGGVGKSTVALFVSQILSDKWKTTIIDMDSQANLTSQYYDNIPAYTVRECLLGECTVNQALKQIRDTLYILPSTLKLSSLDSEVSHMPNRIHLLQNLISQIDSKFIIIDNGPTLSIQNILSLCVADIILIPLEMNNWALSGAKMIISQIYDLQKSLGKKYDKITIIPTKIEETTIMTKTFKEIIEQDEELSKYISDHQTTKKEDLKKIIYGGLFITDDSLRDSVIYKEYKSIADEILE